MIQVQPFECTTLDFSLKSKCILVLKLIIIEKKNYHRKKNQYYNVFKFNWKTRCTTSKKLYPKQSKLFKQRMFQRIQWIWTFY